MDDEALIALMKVGKFAEKAKKIKDSDEGHQNNAETSRKLNDLYNSKAGQEVRNLLNNRPRVNPSLA